jgi:hypothetical protein
MSAKEEAPKGRIAAIFAPVRLWIRTNITGEGNARSYTHKPDAKPVSDQEKWEKRMEDAEFLPPDPFSAKPDARYKFVEFYVKKLRDVILGGIGALLTWLFLRTTGIRLVCSEDNSEKVELILSAAVWLVSYSVLKYKRRE